MNQNVSIKSIDELYKESINSDNVAKHVQTLIEHVEEEIRASIRTRQSTIRVPLVYGAYMLESFNHKESTRIMVFNLMIVLKREGYKFHMEQHYNGYDIIIDISECAGQYIDQMMEDFINSYKK